MRTLCIQILKTSYRLAALMRHARYYFVTLLSRSNLHALRACSPFYSRFFGCDLMDLDGTWLTYKNLDGIGLGTWIFKNKVGKWIEIAVGMPTLQKYGPIKAFRQSG